MLGGGLLVVSLIAIYVVVFWVIANETGNGNGKIGLLAIRNTPRKKIRNSGLLKKSSNETEQPEDKPSKTPGYLKQ